MKYIILLLTLISFTSCSVVQDIEYSAKNWKEDIGTPGGYLVQNRYTTNKKLLQQTYNNTYHKK